MKKKEYNRRLTLIIWIMRLPEDSVHRQTGAATVRLTPTRLQESDRWTLLTRNTHIQNGPEQQRKLIQDLKPSRRAPSVSQPKLSHFRFPQREYQCENSAVSQSVNAALNTTNLLLI